MLAHLLFVTFHIQMGLGHIGIAFLTSKQRRKNMLIRMDVENVDPALAGLSKKQKKKLKQQQQQQQVDVDGSEGKVKKFDPSRNFRRSAPTFIFFTVLPYMFQVSHRYSVLWST